MFTNWVHKKKASACDILDGPLVQNPPCRAGEAGSIPGQGTKIPHATPLASPRAGGGWWADSGWGCLQSKEAHVPCSFLSSEVLVPTRDHRALSAGQKELPDAEKGSPQVSLTLSPRTPGMCTRVLRPGGTTLRFAEAEAHVQQS